MSLKLVGHVLGKKYRILDKLGEGGMASVFRAQDVRIGRDVAIKILPSWNRDDRSQVGRFTREVRLLADLSHPSIVGIFDFGQDGDVVYYVMEYLPGGSLADLLKTQGALPLEQILKVARDMAKALECIHAMEIVHRDIKPHNILLTDGGDNKLADFGLGKASEFESLTRVGELIGTLKYLPPEGLEGQPMDHRADLFQLGLVLYECAAGQRAFRGATAVEILRSYSRDEPRSLLEIRPELPQSLDVLVRNLIHTEPEDRYQGAGQVLADLARVQKNQPVRERLPRMRDQKNADRESANAPALAPKMDPRVIGAIGAFVVLIVLAFGFMAGGSTIPGGIHELATTVGEETVRITWSSDVPYRGRIEYRFDDQSVVSVVEESTSVAKHLVNLLDLKAGRDYVIRVMEPGAQSSETQAQTRPFNLSMTSAAAGFGQGVLEWSSSQDCTCWFEVKRPGGRQVLPIAGPARPLHRVRFESLGARTELEMSIACENVVGETRRIEVNPWAVERGQAMEAFLSGVDVGALAGRMLGLGRASPPAAARVVLQGLLDEQGFLRAIREFRPASGYYLGNPAFSLESRVSLLGRIQDLEAVNRSLALTGLMVSLPVEDLPLPGSPGEDLFSPEGLQSIMVRVKPRKLLVRGSGLEPLAGFAQLGNSPSGMKLDAQFDLVAGLEDMRRILLEVDTDLDPYARVRFSLNGRGPLALGPAQSGPREGALTHRAAILPGLVHIGKNDLEIFFEKLPGFYQEGESTARLDAIRVQVDLGSSIVPEARVPRAWSLGNGDVGGTPVSLSAP